MAYGVQVKATITSADVNAEELRKAVQGALDDAIKANPIVVKSFTAKINNRTVTHLRSSIQQAIDTGTSQKPIQIKNFSAKLTAKERNAIVKQMRADLDAGGLVVKIQRIDASNAVTNLRKQLTTMLSGLSIGGLKEFLGDTASSEALERNAKAAEKLAEATENVKKKTEAATVAVQRLRTLTNKTNSIDNSLFGMTDEDARSGYQAQVVAILSSIEEARNATGRAQEELIAGIQEAVQKLNDETAAHLRSQKAAEKKAAAIERAGGEEAIAAAEATKSAKREEAARAKEIADTARIVQLQKQIAQWKEKNPTAYWKYQEEIDRLLNRLKSDTPIARNELEQLALDFKKVDQAAEAAGEKGSSFIDKLIAGWKKFGGWTIITRSMTLAINTVKNMVRAVTELDAAMTELRKVTDLTERQYESFLADATAMAKNVGATIADSVNAVADFSRLGFDLVDATALAEAALVYKNVGDGIDDISTATESLISTVKAFEDFGYAAEDAMFIVDKFNEVGNNFAISSSGIGEALRRSASSLAAAGNDLDQSIGLITAMNSVIQDPDVVGTALKTVSMYLRAAKTEAEEAGIETEGMANSVAELREEIKALTGVDIMLDEDTFKSTFEIMRELSDVWGELSDVTRANVLELIGGKRNGNVITSLLNNFDDAIAAAEAARNAMGSAAAENEKYLDSINGKLAEMKASFEAMSNAFIDSDLVKVLIDLLTLLMKVVTAVQELGIALPALGMVMSYFANKSMVSSLDKVALLLSKIGLGTGVITSLSKAIGVIAPLFGGLSTVLLAVAAAQTAYNAALQPAIDRAHEIEDVYSDANDTYQKNVQTLEGLRSRFDTLSEGVGENGENISLTASEYDEYNSIIEQIAAISPDLVRGYENERIALYDYNDVIDDAIEAQRTLREEREKTYRSSGKEIFAGYKNENIQLGDDLVGYANDILGAYFGTSAKGVFSGMRIPDPIANKLFEKIGVSLGAEAGEGINFSTEHILALYENVEEFIFAVRQWNKKSGELSDAEIDAMRESILSMSPYIEQILELREKEAENLISTLFSGDDMWSALYQRYVPSSASNDFMRGLASIVDFENGSYEDHLDAAIGYLADYTSAVSSDVGTILTDMGKQFAVGEGDITKYNATLAAFYEQNKDNPAGMAAYEYFSRLPEAIRQGGNALDDYGKKIDSTTQSVSDTIKQAEASQNVRDKYQDYVDGKISELELIQAVDDALVEGERLDTYLTDENGKLQLNAEAWDNRESAMYNSLMSGIRAQNKMLQQENNTLDTDIQKANAYINGTGESEPGLYDSIDEAQSKLDEWTAKQAENSEIIGYNSLLLVAYEDAIKNVGVVMDESSGKAAALTEVIDKMTSAGELFSAANKAALTNNGVFQTISADDALKFAEDIDRILGEDGIWQRFLSDNGNGTFLFNSAGLRTYLLAWAKSQESVKGHYDAVSRLMNIDTSGNPFDKITEAIDKATKAAKYFQSAREDMKKDSVLSADTVSLGRDLFGEDFNKYATGFAGGYKFTAENEEAVRSFGLEAMTASSAGDALISTIMQLFNDTPDTNKIERLTKSLSNISNASSLISTINQELSDSGSNSLDTLASFIEMYGEGWQEHVSWSNGIKISTDAVKALSEAEIDAMEISDAAKEQMRAQRDAAIETAKANEDLADSYSNIKSAASLGGEYGNDAELTYDAYQQLIAADNRYAYALEFQNGVLTINQEKHAQITETILAETAAKALEEAQTLALDGRYIELTSRIGELNDEEQKELDTRNAQIMGLTVYANELNNANSALNRFLSSTERANSIGYDGAADALQTIKDVLTNKKSDMYGMVGHDKFQSAVKLLISPEIEIGSAEYKRQMKTLERYITEDGKGMSNLYSDMLSKGIIDETTGAVNMSLEEMANALGLTVSAMQLLIDQFNLYQEEGNKLEVNYDNTGASDAQADLEGTKTAAENAQTPLQQVAATIGEIKSGYEALTASPLDIDVSSRTTSALENTYNTLGNILKKLQAIQDVGTITTTVAVNQTGSSGGFVSNLIGGVINRLTGSSSAGGTDRAVGGKTLVGELGREAVVDPSNNRWYTVGDNGPEFVNLPKNAIVFNAKQTEELLRAGRTRMTGESMASGNAAASLFSNIINTAKSVANSIKNGIVSAVKKASSGSDVDAISGAAPKATGSTGGGLKVSGTPTKPSTGSGKSSGGGSGSSKKDPEDELTVLEKIQKKYEEINAQTEHLIEHQEHFYKVSENGLDFDGMGSSLAAQVQLYQKMMTDAQAGIAEMRAAGASDTDKELQEMERVYWDAYDSMHDLLDEINELYVNGLNDKIDGIQGAFATLQDAASELSNDGAISVDTFQKLLDNGINYMSLLEKTGDQYTINEDRVRALLAAEKEQLAVENALAYVNQLKQALTDKDADLTQNLINLTNDIGDSTWAAVYAQAALLKNLGLTDDQYQAIIDNLDAMREISGKVADDLSTDTSELFKEQKTAIDYILKKTEELIKFETEQQIDAIEDQIDAYKEIINLKKESLQKSREEEEYQKSVSEKTQEIARIQAKLGQLSLDDSREAEAQRAEYMEKLKDLQEDLGNLQTNRSDEMTQEMLDKQLEDYENSKKEEIERLEEQISSTEKIYQLAIERLSNGWDSIYQEIITWNTNVGNTLNEEITENWNIALAAAQKYGSYIAALNAMDGSGKVSLSGDGLPKYHSGGIVDDRGSINDKEVLAVLKKGELVADESAKNAIFEAVDFVDALSKRLKTKIGNIASGAGRSIYHAADKLMSGGSLSALSASGANGMVFSPTITVAIQHSGTMTDSDADRYGRRIADTALDTLYNRFKTSGIGSTSNIRLRT